MNKRKGSMEDMGKISRVYIQRGSVVCVGLLLLCLLFNNALPGLYSAAYRAVMLS